MDRPDVVYRISQLKAEIDRIRKLALNCAPPVSSEMSSLADEMSAHVSVLEKFLANDPALQRSEGI